MLEIKIKNIFISKNYIFGNKRLSFSLYDSYLQMNERHNSLWYFIEECYTKEINLLEDIESIKLGFSKNCVYEIRRALSKDDVRFDVFNDVNEFVNFFNVFAEMKKRPKLKYSDILIFGNNIIFIKVIKDNQTIAMHSYLIDKELGIAKLHQSASHFRFESDLNSRALTGRANRALHFESIKYFKSGGFKVYDLGGYGMDEKDNKEVINVNNFKDTFGGKLKKYYNYQPILKIIIRKIKRLMSK